MPASWSTAAAPTSNGASFTPAGPRPGFTCVSIATPSSRGTRTPSFFSAGHTSAHLLMIASGRWRCSHAANSASRHADANKGGSRSRRASACCPTR